MFLLILLVNCDEKVDVEKTSESIAVEKIDAEEVPKLLRVGSNAQERISFNQSLIDSSASVVATKQGDMIRSYTIKIDSGQSSTHDIYLILANRQSNGWFGYFLSFIPASVNYSSRSKPTFSGTILASGFDGRVLWSSDFAEGIPVAKESGRVENEYFADCDCQWKFKVENITNMQSDGGATAEGYWYIDCVCDGGSGGSSGGTDFEHPPESTGIGEPVSLQGTPEPGFGGGNEEDNTGNTGDIVGFEGLEECPQGTWDTAGNCCPNGVNNLGVCMTLEEARIQQLSSKLEQDPFALLENCDQIEAWQDLAQHTPPPAVLDKIQNLDDNYLSIISGDWDLQYLQEAKGPVVNLDYFPVKITELPINPSTGQRFTPEGFFNYVRTNLDAFFENNSTGFGPYNEAEEAIWNSSNYLGAIMRFEITPLPGMSQDGSVICSEKQNNNWKFITIESPEDWSHPVSGNREFGLELNSDGSYIFFTRGVDRVAEREDEFIGNLGIFPTAFEGADDLWTAFQDNLEAFINNPNNGGQAHKQSPKIDRPDWDKVRDVLEGNRPISDLGCN